jgi:hypothetical protein
MRNKMVNLSARSVKHFLPDVEIHCLTLFKSSRKEYEKQEPLLPFIKEFKERTKYISPIRVYDGNLEETSGYGNPMNGAYFIEGYNIIQNKFKDYDGKLLILAEDHFFTTGKTLNELVKNDWELAYAPAFHRNEGTANGSILGINPFKLNSLFPLLEVHNVPIERSIAIELLKKVPNKYRIKHRIWTDYCGDGIYTNSSEEMTIELKKARII